MSGYYQYFELSTLSVYEVVIRILLALCFGFILGWDRDRKNKPIDFRAYMIVAATTCLMAIMGYELSDHLAKINNSVTLDLGKIIAGVLTGIGFLGAGAIIKRENDQVVGTATGASIWASGGMGLAIGFGFYTLSLIAFSVVTAILVIGGIFMPKVAGKNDEEDKPH